MSVLVNKDSKIIVQGFTGSEGTFHATQMIEYGTNVVGGVTPGKGGQSHLDRPVFNTVAEAVAKVRCQYTQLSLFHQLLPLMQSWKLPMLGIKVIITITEGIPVADMVKASNYIAHKDCRLIGPNCPGVITPEKQRLGLCPVLFSKREMLESFLNQER